MALLYNWYIIYVCSVNIMLIFFDFSVFEKYNIIEISHNIKEGIR